MDYLQYCINCGTTVERKFFRFKPYYKWITFNTEAGRRELVNITL